MRNCSNQIHTKSKQLKDQKKENYTEHVSTTAFALVSLNGRFNLTVIR